MTTARPIANLDAFLKALQILAPVVSDLADYIEGRRATKPVIFAQLPEELQSEIELARAWARASGASRA